MDRLKNISKQLRMQSVTFFVVVFSNYGNAGVSGDGYWVVESGDSVYSIARNIFPDDRAKQRQFRNELIQNNRAVLKGNPGRINVGDKLALPAFAISKPVTPKEHVEEKVTQVQAEAATPAIEPVIETEKTEAVTPDPEEVIGHVVISVGKMQASNRGTFRDLLRNSKIFKGDTITTAKNSYTQVRMKDGALLSLRPNTKLAITDYNFNGKEDGSERNFMELVRGGFRTITGYIGHKNKRNYRVKTAVATIGIRGTHYGLMVCSDGSCSDEAEPLEDGVYGGVVDGSINVANNSGEYTFNNDQYFHVANASSAAVEQLVPPPVFHGSNDRVYAEKDESRESKQSQTQQKSTNGKKRELETALTNKAKSLTGDIDTKKTRGNRLGSLVRSYVNNKPPLVLPDQVNDVIKDKPVFIDAPDGSAVLIGLLGTNNQGAPDHIAASVFVRPDSDGNIILGAKQTATGAIIKNIPVAISEVDKNNGNVYQLFLPSATAGVSFIEGNPIGVNWGRWTGDYVLTENDKPLPTQGDLHYVYSDQITSPTQIATLGGLKSTTSYTLAGNTTPTDPAGNELKLSSLTMTTDFVAQEIVDYTVVVSDPTGSSSFNMSAQNIPFLVPDPATGNVMHEFDLNDFNCTSCIGRASTAFVGKEAQGVITTFSMGDTLDPTKGANGAAVLIDSAAPVQ